ncbi:MAG: hypothetical protein JJE40_14705 [Vicinamibacteria bacterium]|nr:hypothetical protein [Vicinamibacteria bacterium]
MTDPATPVSNASGEAAPAPRPLVGLIPAIAGGALLIDAAIETFRSGSPVRWWVVAAAACYLGATAAAWRRPIGWRGRLAAVLLVLLALVAGTAWLPGGLGRGLRMLGQPTPTIVAALVAIGVALAGYELVGWKGLPLAARAVIGVLATYGASAFTAGALAGTPLDALFSGASLWQRLPRLLQGAWVGGLLLLPLGLAWALVHATLRRPAATSARAAWWKVTALTASIATVLAGLPLTSRRLPAPPATRAEALAATLGLDPDAPKLSASELETALTNSLRAIEDGERDMPRDRWDPAWVAARLGSDPARLFAWVQGNTFWIPYRGLLRGPIGVLMDRLGNTLDRAALLATLLRDSGRRVRFARGSLAREQAMEALRRLLVARYAHAPTESQEATDPVSAVTAQYQLDETAVRRTLVAQIDARSRHEAVVSERVPD